MQIQLYFQHCLEEIEKQAFNSNNNNNMNGNGPINNMGYRDNNSTRPTRERGRDSEGYSGTKDGKFGPGYSHSSPSPGPNDNGKQENGTGQGTVQNGLGQSQSQSFVDLLRCFIRY